MRGPRALKGFEDPQIVSKELGDRKQDVTGGTYRHGTLAEPLTTEIACGNIGQISCMELTTRDA